MKLRKWRWTLLAMLAVMLIVAGCGQSSDSGPGTAGGSDGASQGSGQQEKTIMIAYNLPKTHTVGVYFETLAEEIEKRTANTSIKLKPQTYPDGQLYNDSLMPNAVSTGLVEIGGVNVGFLNRGDSDPLQIYEFLFMFDSWEAAWAGLEGTFGELFKAELESVNMHTIGFAPYGPGGIFGNFPIRVPEDIKGKKIRSTGTSTARAIEFMGASPVVISSQEVYQALENGVVDGFFTGKSSVMDRHFYEVAKYAFGRDMFFTDFSAVAHKPWWDSLPADVQQAIMEASEVATQKARELALQRDLEYRNGLIEKGMVFYDPTEEEIQKWKEAMKPSLEKYLKDTGEKGQKFVDAINEANAAVK